jgi:hypothetical protein
MKKTFNTLYKIQVIAVVTAVLLAILIFTNDSYYWSLKIVYILLAINLIIGGIREFRQNKKSLYAYCNGIIDNFPFNFSLRVIEPK